MATISRQIAEDVIAGKYDDYRPVKIVKYTNKWGGESYGLICKGSRMDNYQSSEFVINPEVY